MADIIASAEVTILDVMDGIADNLYLAYADNASGSVGFGFTPKPTSKYIGTYKSKETTQSNDHTRYKWLRHSGADGLPGPKGDDGLSSYIHTAYANSPDGSVQFSTIESEGRRYVGMYTDFSMEDSADYTRYKWVDMSGDIKPGGENYLSDWLFEDDSVWYTTSGTPSTAMTKTRLENGVLECRSTNTDWNQLQINSLRGSVETSPGFKNIISGQPYTLSFWMRHVDSPALQVTASVRLNKKPTGVEQYLLKTFDLTAEWKKYEVTGVISYDINTVDYWRTIFAPKTPGTFQIKRPVLEWGNVATDGAPSPYDAKKAIDAASDKLTVDLNTAIQLAQNALASANAIARELQNQPYYKITEQKLYEAAQAELRRTSDEQLNILKDRTAKIVEYLGDMTTTLVFQSKALTVGEEGVMFASQDLAQAVKINDNRISFHTGGNETAAFTGGELNIDRVNVSTKLQKGNFIEEPDDKDPTLMIVRYKE